MSRRIFPTQYTAKTPAAMKISMPMRMPRTVLDMSESRLRFVKDVEEYGYAQGSEGIGQGCEQRHQGNQAPREAQQIEDQVSYQQNGKQDCPDQGQQ
jgi:hypothetical protein